MIKHNELSETLGFFSTLVARTTHTADSSNDDYDRPLDQQKQEIKIKDQGARRWRPIFPSNGANAIIEYLETTNRGLSHYDSRASGDASRQEYSNLSTP